MSISGNAKLKGLLYAVIAITVFSCVLFFNYKPVYAGAEDQNPINNEGGEPGEGEGGEGEGGQGEGDEGQGQGGEGQGQGGEGQGEGGEGQGEEGQGQGEEGQGQGQGGEGQGEGGEQNGEGGPNRNVPPDNPDPNNNMGYDYNATLYDPDPNNEHQTPDHAHVGEDRPGGYYPGVYVTEELQRNQATEANAPTVGISSIADDTLANQPTTESPAIIQGAAIGYEIKTGAVSYTTYEQPPSPYAEYRYTITQQPAADGTMQPKLTGFDQTYVIVRLDVSQFYDYDPATYDPTQVPDTYLHIKQEANLALIPGAGIETDDKTPDGATETAKGGNTFTDQTGTRTGVYSLKYLLEKATDAITGVIKPYVDVLLFATSSNVAGADAGKADAPDGDVKLQMYTDTTLDYNPALHYDPQSTDPNHITNCLAKFFDATKVAAENISRYLIKGSDLKLEVAVAESGGAEKNTGTTYWSLKKAFEEPYYDQDIDASPNDTDCGRTVKLISEVAIVDQLTLQGANASYLRKRTLDVNSFDVQIAKNSGGEQGAYPAGFTVTNAWLKVEDTSATTGSELAIGNNAHFIIDAGGKLIIDETCQLEIEWDGQSTTNPDGTPAQSPDQFNNGLLDLRAGGTLENYGVISIEGYEGKPYPEGQQPAIPVDGCGELTINQGATLINNGCIMANGKLYNLGTIINNGNYEDVITSTDPDNGRFDYHKGINVSWKDDVTQQGVQPGEIANGQKGNLVVSTATITNNGSILLSPGTLNNYGVIDNENGHIYMAAATEAIIPIEATQQAPTVESKRITLNPPRESVITNHAPGTISHPENIMRVYVKLNNNTSLGTMTVYDVVQPSEEHPDQWEMKNYDGYVIPGTEHEPEIPGEDEENEGKGEEDAEKILIFDDLTGVLMVNGKVLSGDLGLFLFNDGTYEIRLADGTVIKGNFLITDGVLRFVLPNGMIVIPEVDTNGHFIYTFRLANGSVVTFTLKADAISRLVRSATVI